MIIRLMSDLHLEFDSENPFLPTTLAEDSDSILILAGDITLAGRMEYSNYFFEAITSQFKNILYVPGNHEYYRGSIDDTVEKLKNNLSKYKNLLVLDNDSIEIDGVTFIGSTLWSEFDKGNPLSMWHCDRKISDFSVIYKDVKCITAFRAEDAYATFLQNKKWLEDTLKETNSEKRIVITHHAPTFRSIHKNYEGNPLNGAYVSDLSELILDYNPLYWFHGHTHDSFDYKIGSTRVICNPRGYPITVSSDGTPVVENRFFNPTFRIKL